MIRYIFLVICSLFLLLFLFLGLLNKRITNRTFLILLICLGLSYVVLMSTMTDPPVAWDLYQHYKEIDLIRTKGFLYCFRDSKYSYLPLTCLLFYVVSLTPFNFLLISISLSIEVFLLIYSIMKYTVKKNVPIERGHYLFAFFYIAFVNIILATSGIRNVLAASICSFAFFRRVCLHKKSWVNILLIFLSIFIHPMCFIFLMLYAFMSFKSYSLSILSIIVFSLFYVLVIPLFANSSILFLRVVCEKLMEYNSIDVQYDKFHLALNFLLVFLAFVNSLFSNEGFLKKFLLLFLIMSCCFLKTPILFDRCLYLLSVVVFPVSLDLFVSFKGESKNSLKILTNSMYFFLAVVLCFYQFYSLYLMNFAQV